MSPLPDGKCDPMFELLYNTNKLSPRGRRDDMPPPMAIRLAVDLCPSADGSTAYTSLVAGQLQAASVPIA